MQRRIVALHALVVSASEQAAILIEESRPDRDAALGEAGEGLADGDGELLFVGDVERLLRHRLLRHTVRCVDPDDEVGLGCERPAQLRLEDLEQDEVKHRSEHETDNRGEVTDR